MGLDKDTTSVTHPSRMKRRSMELYCIHMLFFISLSAPMTSIAPVLPVAFWTVGSWRRSAHIGRCYTRVQMLTSNFIKTLYSFPQLAFGPQNSRFFKCTFSSPIVNFPCVCTLFSAKDCSFFTGSVCSTVVKNLTFCLVYSCPGCPLSVSHTGFEDIAVGYTRRLWYRLVAPQESCSRTHAFLLGCPQKTFRILDTTQ